MLPGNALWTKMLFFAFLDTNSRRQTTSGVVVLLLPFPPPVGVSELSELARDVGAGCLFTWHVPGSLLYCAPRWSSFFRKQTTTTPIPTPRAAARGAGLAPAGHQRLRAMLPRPAILRALQRRDFEPLPNGKDVETACHLGIPLLVTNTKLRRHWPDAQVRQVLPRGSCVLYGLNSAPRRPHPSGSRLLRPSFAARRPFLPLARRPREHSPARGASTAPCGGAKAPRA